MRVQSNGLAGPNIAAGSGEARSSKQFLRLMRVCSVPKASFPVLQERLVLSVDDFFRIPVSAEGNGAEQPKKNHQRQPNNACISSRQQQRDKKQTTASQSGSEEQTRARPRRLLEYSAHALGTGWPVRGASSARPSVRAQCNLGRGYLHILHLLGCCTLCTTWQWLASFACSPLQYRRDSRAEVTAHRAWPAASDDPWTDKPSITRRIIARARFARLMQSDVGER